LGVFLFEQPSGFPPVIGMLFMPPSHILDYLMLAAFSVECDDTVVKESVYVV